METSKTHATNLLHKLYEWWTTQPSTHQVGDFLDVDLVYDGGFEGLRDNDLVWWVQQKPPWNDLCVIDEVVSERKGALVFEGIDSTTLLRHRVAWLIEIRNGRIFKIIETVARRE